MDILNGLEAEGNLISSLLRGELLVQEHVATLQQRIYTTMS